MKLVTSLSKRFRVSLALLTTLAVLPLGSALHSAEAKPKAGAPAYGYRAKQSKAQKRYDKRARKAQKRYEKRAQRRDRNDDYRDDYRDNDYRNGDYRSDDYRQDYYPEDDYRNNRNGAVRNEAEARIRDYFGL